MSKTTTFGQLRALAEASQSFSANVAAAAADAIEEVNSEIATEEESSTASAAHAAGSYLKFNGNLYKVTQAIAIGDTIVSDVNVTKTTVAEELATISGSTSGLVYSEVTETVTIPTSIGTYTNETIIFV